MKMTVMSRLIVQTLKVVSLAYALEATLDPVQNAQMLMNVFRVTVTVMPMLNMLIPKALLHVLVQQVSMIPMVTEHNATTSTSALIKRFITVIGEPFAQIMTVALNAVVSLQVTPAMV